MDRGIDNLTRRRLAALGDYAICDSEPEAQFDDIAFIASQVCATPVALVSLIETHRQWFKARVGVDLTETPIAQSVCQLGLASTDLLIIPDLTADDRTCRNILVTDAPAIRFYAGAPLVTPEGVVIGMLCVIDVATRPQGLSQNQQRMLRGLAAQVIALLELRKALGVSTALAARSLTAEEAGNVGTFEAAVDGDVTLVSPEFCRIFGVPPRAEYPVAFLEALVVSVDDSVRSTVSNRGDGSADPIVEYRIRRPSDGMIRWISRRAEFVRDDAGRVTHMIGLVQDVTDQRLLNHEISHRLKNTLALVQSIASQSLRGVADRGPVMEFDRRLLALATAHDVLLDRTRATAPVRSIIDAAVDSMSAKERTSTDGPDLELNAQSTLNLAMMIHELVTNSMKYGALSVSGGMNHVRWHLDDDGATFVLEWIEQGGPATVKPAKTGFGTRLIARGLGSASQVETRYGETGFSASLRVPVSAIS